MDGLPRDLVDKTLLRVDLRSLAMMRCTSRSLQTHIYDPYFESEYSSRSDSICCISLLMAQVMSLTTLTEFLDGASTTYPGQIPPGTEFENALCCWRNSITLVSATEKLIYFYALTNIISDRRPKWVLLKQIHNGVMDKKKLYYWNVLTYNDKCLVLIGCSRDYNRVVHVYLLSDNKWVPMGLVPGWCDANQILACGNRRISSLSSIIALIDGSSSEEVENQLKKRSAEHNFLYEQSTNRKRRLV
ncbi:unnamed protein product [Brassica rapa]|uniref:F-box domain-containing protein n=1 Tax=Brassica campestris TaxID=3711 RepID=A0A8D9G1U9_BRACM|nr:unnamed protein product [Brassica rapa]